MHVVAVHPVGATQIGSYVNAAAPLRPRRSVVSPFVHDVFSDGDVFHLIGDDAEVYTLQRRTLKANLYKYTYTYVVKGREYTAEKSSLSDKPDMELPIWFNKNDPADSEFESPCDWMAKNGNSFAVSGFVDKSIFFVGLIMLLYGGWKTLTSFVRLIISAFKKEQPTT